MARNWKKVLGFSLAGAALSVVGLVLVVIYALSSTPSTHSVVLNQAFYKALLADKAALPLPNSAVFVALEDSVTGMGAENEYTGRCLLRTRPEDFDIVVATIAHDTAFKASQFDILTTGSSYPQPGKVVATAQRLGLRKQDFTRVFTRESVGRYRCSLGFHKNRQYIYLNYLTY